MKHKCPAAVHIDGTARPQLVSEKSNSSFHKILVRYYKLTGIPCLINTSFNMHEEPIVCSPEDAIRAFMLGRLDYLAIGKYLVRHPDIELAQAERKANERE
jgi:carbamoyltransferase